MKALSSSTFFSLLHPKNQGVKSDSSSNGQNRFQWDDKAGHYWVPENIENHHGSSTLSQRLLSKGLISEKAPEEIERSRQWRVHVADHHREVTAFKKRVDTVANLASEKHRPCKRRSGIGCVFCGTWGKNLYVCSSCCMKLLGSSDESLKMSYLLAVWHGLGDKADALLDFISPGVAQEVEDEIELTRTGKLTEVSHEQRKSRRNAQECFNGEKPVRPTRHEQKSNWRFAQGKGPTLYQTIG